MGTERWGAIAHFLALSQFIVCRTGSPLGDRPITTTTLPSTVDSLHRSQRGQGVGYFGGGSFKLSR